MSSLGPVLSGCTILVTAQRRAEDLANALERRGAVVHRAATLGVVSQIDEETLLTRTHELIDHPLDVLVVTTGIGFRGWLDTAETAGLGDLMLKSLMQSRLIARGPKARGALQAAGLRADWVAESETAAEIAEFLCTEGVEGQRIAVQQHGAGDDGLGRALAAAGADVSGLVIYQWGPPPDPDAVAESVREIADGGYDAVLFTSAPGAAAWLAAIDDAGVREQVLEQTTSGRLVAAAVGPVTAGPLRDAGIEPLMPDRGRMGALVRSVIMRLGDPSTGIGTAVGHLRLHARSATLDHEVLPLSRTGLALLRALAAQPGQVLSREQLLKELSGDSTDPHTAEVAIARMRDALGGRDLVRTVVKRGYRLNLDDEERPAT